VKELHTSYTLGKWGTGTHKERDEVTRREVRKCDRKKLFIEIGENENWVSCENFFVYYESINRGVQTRPMYVCRCDERLKTYFLFILNREIERHREDL
jgi:hypothetical protein